MSYNFGPDNHLFKQSSFVVNTLFEMRIWSLENEMRFKSRLAKRKSSICNLDFIFIGLSPNIIFVFELECTSLIYSATVNFNNRCSNFTKYIDKRNRMINHMRLYIHNRMEQSTNDKKDAIVFALSSSGLNSRRATT